MSHQKRLTKILLVSLFVLGLTALGFILEIPRVLANGQDVCPDGGDWTKVEPGPFNYNAPSGYVVDAVCIKGGSDGSANGYLKTFTSDGWYQVGNPLENCVGASGIGTGSASALQGSASGSICADISHASFRIKEEPKEETPSPTPTFTATPTFTPTPTFTATPTEEPKEGALSLFGECAGEFVVWTITNGNDIEIPFSWKANNGQSGQGSVPANSAIKVNTNLDATEMTINYLINNEPAELKASIDQVCSEDPTPTPTDPPKEEPTPTNPKPEVDPKPDLAAGGSGPSLGSILTLLVIAGGSLGAVTYLTVKIKKGESLIK